MQTILDLESRSDPAVGSWQELLAFLRGFSLVVLFGSSPFKDTLAGFLWRLLLRALSLGFSLEVFL